MISSTKEIHGGTPVLEGTSKPVSLAIAELCLGSTVDECAEKFGITRSVIVSALDTISKCLEKPPMGGKVLMILCSGCDEIITDGPLCLNCLAARMRPLERKHWP